MKRATTERHVEGGSSGEIHILHSPSPVPRVSPRTSQTPKARKMKGNILVQYDLISITCRPLMGTNAVTHLINRTAIHWLKTCEFKELIANFNHRTCPASLFFFFFSFCAFRFFLHTVTAHHWLFRVHHHRTLPFAKTKGVSTLIAVRVITLSSDWVVLTRIFLSDLPQLARGRER